MDEESQNEEIDRYKLRLELLREVVKEQADHFDAIDSKVAAALGFAFIAIGQVVTGVFRTDTRVFHENCAVTALLWAFFGAVILFFLVAVVAGVVARWPRTFDQSVYPDESGDDYLKMLQDAVVLFKEVTGDNDKTLDSKSKWATVTYLFVALSVVASLGLLVTLFAAVSRL